MLHSTTTVGRQPREWVLKISCQPVVIAAFAAALLWTGLLAFFPDYDLDIWWHLRTGRLILDTGTVPRVDSFTYTAAGRPWVDHEWLAEVVFAQVHRLGGFEALSVLRSLAAMSALAFGAWAGLVGTQRAPRLPAAALGILLAAPLIATRAVARPHLFTAVFIALVLLLLRMESHTGRARWRWLLPPLFVLWANLHAGFVQGLLLIVLYWAGEALSARLTGDRDAPAPSWRGRLVVLGVTVLACLANPNRVHALLYPFLLTSRAEFTDIITELRSVFHPAYAGALFLWALGAVAALGAGVVLASRRARQWSLILPAAVFGVLALRHLRGLNEFAPLVPALLAAHGMALGRGERLRHAVAAAVLALAVGGGAAVAHWGTPVGTQPNLRVGSGMASANVPASAVRFIKEVRPEGRLFNLMAYGSYCIHELWPDRQMYVDGRLDVYPPGFLAAYTRLMSTGEGWDDIVTRHGIAVALVDFADPAHASQGLRRRLREDPQWACVYFGDTGLVYLRRTPQNEPILRRYATPFDPSVRTPESLQRFVTQADSAQIAQAESALGAIVAFAPQEAAPRTVLGQLLMQVADQEMKRGRLPQAAAALERATVVDPRQHLPWLRLGIVCAQMGRLDLARQYLERAAALRPDDPDVVANLRTLRQVEARQRPGSPTPR